MTGRAHEAMLAVSEGAFEHPAFGRCLVVDGPHHRCGHGATAGTLEDVVDSLTAHVAMVHGLPLAEPPPTFGFMAGYRPPL